MVTHFKYSSILFAFLFLISCQSSRSQPYQNELRSSEEKSFMRRKHIILIGASIGKAWNLVSLSNRIDNHNFIIEYIHGGGFNKTEKIRESISRKENNPDAVIIKQCAAYFPGDSEKMMSLMEQWVQECKNKNVIPIPATVIPVTRLHSLKKIIIDIIKSRRLLHHGNPFKHNRNKAILEYNDWLKDYCCQNGLIYLDLEEALHYSKKNRFLREDFSRIDGLHLNNKAYQVLDPCLIHSLDRIKWE